MTAKRIAVDAHWTSDVVAGALLGTAVGRWVVHRHRPAPDEEADTRRLAWAIGPAVGPTA